MKEQRRLGLPVRESDGDERQACAENLIIINLPYNLALADKLSLEAVTMQNN